MHFVVLCNLQVIAGVSIIIAQSEVSLNSVSATKAIYLPFGALLQWIQLITQSVVSTHKRNSSSEPLPYCKHDVSIYVVTSHRRQT